MATVNPQNEETFPSYKDFYGKFKNGGGIKSGSCDSTCNAEATEYNLKVRGYGAQVASSMTALTYIYDKYKKKEEPSHREARHFFYYWLGDLISKIKKGDANFRPNIKLICEEINKHCGPGGNQSCGIPCDNPDEAIFPKRKKIFDYYYDYSRIKGNLLQNGPNCDPQWSDYFSKVSSACSAVEEECAEREENKGQERTYCEEFKTNYLPYCTMAKLTELQCDLESKLTSLERKIASEAAKTASSIANDAVGGATTTASLTSTMVAVGLQTILLLLYRYGPLSSWFNNHSSGRTNRRKKRSTTRNPDTLAEDSSTYDSANESIVGDSVAESATVRSAAYTGQPTGRTGTNNNNSTLIHRSNIGYGRM